MSTNEFLDPDVTPGAPPAPLAFTRSACTPPQRHALATRLDKAQAFALLFDEPAKPVKIGRFTLLEPVGSGGMGEIYAAYDEQLDRKVALKLVRSDRFSLPQADERLLREAQTMARLSHPNVVHVYEAGRCEGRVFIAMELIRGDNLRVWLHKRAGIIGDRARQREVLRQFVAAGRGLQAAHEAGLVHRDFKPDNVLVGDDDRPRVVDFGLARFMAATGAAALESGPGSGRRPQEVTSTDTLPADAPTPPPETPPLRPAQALTTRGPIVGTPPYMAPEQMRGEVGDHRSDQFSFCVALYKALYGRPPFAGTTLDELRQAAERGAIDEPPRQAKVPAAVRKALLRGLAVDPEDRFADMGALLAVLEAWPRQRRRRRIAAGLMAAAVAAGAAYAVADTTSPGPCADIGAAVDGAWTPARRAAIGDAFARTELPYAETIWRTLEPRIDQYAQRLDSDLEASCEAAHSQRRQASLAKMRMLCLSSRQRRLDALLDRLEHADAAVVERAHLAASALPDLATCQHPGMLRYGMPSPPPEAAAEVADIRDQLAAARTQELLGHGDEALRIARDQLARAEALGYRAVQAEALFQIGRVLVFRGTAQEIAEGEAMLHRAANAAVSERHDELVAEIWNYLVLGAARNHSSTERARKWYEYASAAVQRIGDPAALRADALRNLGRLYYEEGQYAEAEAYQRQALAALEAGPDLPPLVRAVYLHDLATTIRRLGRREEARDKYERALALHRAALGDTHPYVADVRFDIAMLHIERGALDTAYHVLEQVLRIHAEVLDEASLLAARTHLGLADVDFLRGALDSARGHAESGLAIYRRAYGPEHIELARGHVLLGAIAFRRGHYREALAAYETALDLQIRHLGSNHVEVGYSQANLAEAEVALGRHDEALARVEQAQHILAPRIASTPEMAPFMASVRGRALLGKGRLEAAAQTLDSAVQQYEDLPGDFLVMERADARWALAQALSALGRGADPKARSLARQALATYEQQSPEVHTPREAVERWLAGTRDRR